MTDFLTFLNTADLDTFTKIPDVTRTVAGNIIAARPFDFVEDCGKVRGVGKNLLGRMQSFFEMELNESRNSALIPVEENAMPAAIEKSQPAQEPAEDQPSFFSRLGQALLNFFRAFLRLLLTLAVIIGIGAVIYYGVPYITQNFVAPVEKNTAQINQLNDELAALQTRSNDLQNQLDKTNTRVDEIEKTIEAQTLSIAKLDEMQTTLEQELTTQKNTVMIALTREVKLTRAIENLSRARLYLAQSNFGLAREDVQSAHDLLVEMQNESEEATLTQAISRLDLALNNLPDFPVVASGDLEIAWQILMTGTQVNATAATFTPEPLVTLTPTPDSIHPYTPTPFDLPTATATP